MAESNSINRNIKALRSNGQFGFNYSAAASFSTL